MKILISFFIILISSDINAQAKSIEKLISMIDNTQISVVSIKECKLKMKSSAGNKIIKMGKEASPKIILLLDDPNKGIIAHFILTEILKNQGGGWGWASCGGTGIPKTDTEITEVITSCFYNGLTIQINPDNTIFATEDSLLENKKSWKKIMRN